MSTSTRTIEIVKTKGGRWHWRAKCAGRIVETGAYPYASRRNARRAVDAKLRARYRLATP